MINVEFKQSENHRLIVLSLGYILILDLVVVHLFMHSLPDVILLYLATFFYTRGVFHGDIITFVMLTITDTAAN